MTRTLLIDLDNTLLKIDQGAYIAAYIQAYSTFVNNRSALDGFTAKFLTGIQKMLENRSPDRTLFEVFAGDLAVSCGIDPEDLKQLNAEFYENIYPELAEFGKPVTGASRFIEEVIRRGDRIAIATNPIYSRSGINQRLAWAGLADNLDLFAMISSYEDFHFAKPNPAFLAELLSRMGWPEEEIIVIGDDIQNDILPAQAMGLPTYQIMPQDFDPDPARKSCGRLEDFYGWLESVPQGQLMPEYERPSAILSILRATPASVDSSLRNSDPAFHRYRPTEKDWTFSEVICHLRDVEREVQLPRLKQVLTVRNPIFPGEDTDAWAVERQYCKQDPSTAYQDFKDARQESLSILEDLGPDDWNRPARHTMLGPTDLRELSSIAAEHDKIHVNQIWNLRIGYTHLKAKK